MPSSHHHRSKCCTKIQPIIIPKLCPGPTGATGPTGPVGATGAGADLVFLDSLGLGQTIVADPQGPTLAVYSLALGTTPFNGPAFSQNTNTCITRAIAGLSLINDTIYFVGPELCAFQSSPGMTATKIGFTFTSVLTDAVGIVVHDTDRIVLTNSWFRFGDFVLLNFNVTTNQVTGQTSWAGQIFSAPGGATSFNVFQIKVLPLATDLPLPVSASNITGQGRMSKYNDGSGIDVDMVFLNGIHEAAPPNKSFADSTGLYLYLAQTASDSAFANGFARDYDTFSATLTYFANP